MSDYALEFYDESLCSLRNIGFIPYKIPSYHPQLNCRKNSTDYKNVERGSEGSQNETTNRLRFEEISYLFKIFLYSIFKYRNGMKKKVP